MLNTNYDYRMNGDDAPMKVFTPRWTKMEEKTNSVSMPEKCKGSGILKIRYCRDLNKHF